MGIRLRLPVVVLAIALLGASSARAAYTERVSVGLGGIQGNAASGPLIYVSPDGRYVVFGSDSTNLGLGSPYGSFLRDRAAGTTTRIAPFEADDVSADLDVLAFGSSSSLVPGDTNGLEDVFVYVRSTGSVERVSVATGGTQALGGDSEDARLSADGRYVAFRSYATNLVPGDGNSDADIFVRDRVTGTTERVNVATDGSETTVGARTLAYAMSPDARYVAFWSRAGNLAPGGVAGAWNVYVRDRVAHTTELASWLPDGSSRGTPTCCSGGLGITPNGRFVALIAELPDQNHVYAALLRDRQLGQTVVASEAIDGSPSGGFALYPSVSDDGRFVGFTSTGTDLIAGDVPPRTDAYVRDLALGTTTRVDVATDGTLAEGQSVSYGQIARDGRSFVFASNASTLVPDDTNAASDIFVHDFTCGDGAVDGLEQCDDGGNVDGDGCDGNCTISTCGNGVVAGTEACDDGVANGADGCCTAACALEDADGDGVCDAADACTAPPPVRARLRVGQVGNGVAARLGFAADVAAAPPLDPPLDPAVNGVRAMAWDHIGQVAFDLVIPGGAGWTVNAAGTAWRYADVARTIMVKVQDRTASLGRVRVAVKARSVPYATGPLPLRGAVFLHPPDGSSGQCGEASFTCVGSQVRVVCH